MTPEVRSRAIEVLETLLRDGPSKNVFRGTGTLEDEVRWRLIGKHAIAKTFT